MGRERGKRMKEKQGRRREGRNCKKREKRGREGRRKRLYRRGEKESWKVPDCYFYSFLPDSSSQANQNITVIFMMVL